LNAHLTEQKGNLLTGNQNDQKILVELANASPKFIKGVKSPKSSRKSKTMIEEVKLKLRNSLRIHQNIKRSVETGKEKVDYLKRHQFSSYRELFQNTFEDYDQVISLLITSNSLLENQLESLRKRKRAKISIEMDDAQEIANFHKFTAEKNNKNNSKGEFNYLSSNSNYSSLINQIDAESTNVSNQAYLDQLRKLLEEDELEDFD